MMQMLKAGGMPILTDDVRTPDESNPRGYFEFESVKRLRSDRSWLDQAAGRAVKIIHLLLRELPTDGRYRYRVIMMKRPIEEVLASQQAMLERQGKTSGDPSVLAKIFASQLAQAEEWMQTQPAFTSMSINHRELMTDPNGVAQTVADYLNVRLDVAAMASTVDPALYRQRRTG